MTTRFFDKFLQCFDKEPPSDIDLVDSTVRSQGKEADLKSTDLVLYVLRHISVVSKFFLICLAVHEE